MTLQDACIAIAEVAGCGLLVALLVWWGLKAELHVNKPEGEGEDACTK